MILGDELWRKVAPFINDADNALGDYIERLHETNAIMSDTQIQQGLIINENMLRMQDGLTGISNTLIQYLQPAFIIISEVGAAAFESIAIAIHGGEEAGGLGVIPAVVIMENAFNGFWTRLSPNARTAVASFALEVVIGLNSLGEKTASVARQIEVAFKKAFNAVGPHAADVMNSIAQMYNVWAQLTGADTIDAAFNFTPVAESSTITWTPIGIAGPIGGALIAAGQEDRLQYALDQIAGIQGRNLGVRAAHRANLLRHTDRLDETDPLQYTPYNWQYASGQEPHVGTRRDLEALDAARVGEALMRIQRSGFGAGHVRNAANLARSNLAARMGLAAVVSTNPIGSESKAMERLLNRIGRHAPDLPGLEKIISRVGRWAPIVGWAAEFAAAADPVQAHAQYNLGMPEAQMLALFDADFLGRGQQQAQPWRMPMGYTYSAQTGRFGYSGMPYFNLAHHLGAPQRRSDARDAAWGAEGLPLLRTFGGDANAVRRFLASNALYARLNRPQSQWSYQDWAAHFNLIDASGQNIQSYRPPVPTEGGGLSPYDFHARLGGVTGTRQNYLARIRAFQARRGIIDPWQTSIFPGAIGLGADRFIRGGYVSPTQRLLQARLLTGAPGYDGGNIFGQGILGPSGNYVPPERRGGGAGTNAQDEYDRTYKDNLRRQEAFIALERDVYVRAGGYRDLARAWRNAPAADQSEIDDNYLKAAQLERRAEDEIQREEERKARAAERAAREATGSSSARTASSASASSRSFTATSAPSGGVVSGGLSGAGGGITYVVNIENAYGATQAQWIDIIEIATEAAARRGTLDLTGATI